MIRGLTKQQEECIPKVVFQLIPIKDLVSNQDYQRPLSESHILKAISEFDVCQINPVKVSRRDGINYVFDGQHTIEIVAAKSGSRDTPVWCMIYNFLEYEEEAHIFAEQQKNKKNLVPVEVFNAHVEAGDPKYILITKLLNSYGLKVAGDKKEQNSLWAISAVENVYDEYGYHILDRTIHLILATWEGENGSFSGTMIKAVAKILNTFGEEIQDEVFKVNVGKHSVRTIVRRAKEISPGIKGYTIEILNAYNEKKKKNVLEADRLFTSCKKKAKQTTEDNDITDETDEPSEYDTDDYEVGLSLK